jgi:glycosyltransferase involved in cell wall biosynthesis
VILIAHPETQHSPQLAAALDAKGLLRLYVHGARLPEYVEKELPLSVRKRIYWYQPLRRLATHIPHKTLARESFSRCLSWYDQMIAALLPRLGAKAVIAYEGSALKTFQTAKKLGIATVLDAANFHHRTQSKWIASSNTEKKILIKDLEIENADLILTCSSLARDSYIDAGIPAERVCAVPLGVDLDVFSSPSGFEGRLGRAREITFCFVGTLDQRKGVDLMAAAAKQLRENGLKFKLAVAGKTFGNDKTIAAAVREVGELRGRVKHEDLSRFYDEADVFILPSRFDAFGMVVSEALACGLPCLVTGNAGSKDLVEEGVSGWIVPAGSSEALAERMAFCIQNPEIVRAMAPKARAAAEARSWLAYRRDVSAVLSDFLRS